MHLTHTPLWLGWLLAGCPGWLPWLAVWQGLARCKAPSPRHTLGGHRQLPARHDLVPSSLRVQGIAPPPFLSRRHGPRVSIGAVLLVRPCAQQAFHVTLLFCRFWISWLLCPRVEIAYYLDEFKSTHPQLVQHMWITALGSTLTESCSWLLLIFCPERLPVGYTPAAYPPVHPFTQQPLCRAN